MSPLVEVDTKATNIEKEETTLKSWFSPSSIFYFKNWFWTAFLENSIWQFLQIKVFVILDSLFL